MSPLAKRRELAWGAGILLALAALALLPLAAHRDDALNFVFLILLSIALAVSWNILAGYVGQVNLGHAAFFGVGALVTRTLWTIGTPILLAMGAGAVAAAVFALPSERPPSGCAARTSPSARSPWARRRCSSDLDRA